MERKCARPSGVYSTRYQVQYNFRKQTEVIQLNTEHSRHKHIRKEYLGERVKHHIQELCGKKAYGMVNMNT